MAINKKLIHFNKEVDFKKELEAGNILETSIIFIKDTRKIYTHNAGYVTIPEGGEIGQFLGPNGWEDNTLITDPNGEVIKELQVTDGTEDAELIYTRKQTDERFASKLDVDNTLEDYAKIDETTVVKLGTSVILGMEIVDDTPDGDLIYTKALCDAKFYTKELVDALIQKLKAELG